MKKLSIFKRAAAAAALSASAVAGIGAVGVMAAGTANAKPAICATILQVWESSLEVSNAAYAQGDYDGAYDHLQTAQMAQKRYKVQGCW